MECSKQQCVGRGSTASGEALGLCLGGTAVAADLGGSSKYSNERFEN